MIGEHHLLAPFDSGEELVVDDFFYYTCNIDDNILVKNFGIEQEELHDFKYTMMLQLETEYEHEHETLNIEKCKEAIKDFIKDVDYNFETSELVETTISLGSRCSEIAKENYKKYFNELISFTEKTIEKQKNKKMEIPKKFKKQAENER
ncbi:MULTISPECIES: hypothetical protein [unclassified Fusobacterium]|uniref:hypothetical protein n=1 Tax=unclassified Fusobacterium TaxID=2648384 RepID=UPI001B8C6295|nr:MULTISPECIES: hypothetical protein [unclassified Fusobacterium]MBR8702346.1 hypothetical protein [Fusobacterium sp. DD45]MBR8712164.1 hypothetical protein [Fusobacterium sp. DD28]MBR8752742.1 hypothetical protein [Fusobacterium sp. DD26]